MTPPDWFLKYLSRGFHLTHYDPKKKGPEGTTALDWNESANHITRPEQYLPDRNWGVFTGVEIQPGRFLCDVDFDFQHDDAFKLANALLPDTKFIFGRESKRVTHAFYTTSTPLAYHNFEDIDKKHLVELRGTTDSGRIGYQTMLPPSLHPDNEVLQMRMDGEIAHTDLILRRVQLYAIGCLLLKHFTNRGLLHDVRLALAGFLLTEGVSEHDVVDLGEALARLTGNDVKDVRATVRSTLIQIKKGEKVRGSGTLAKAIGVEGHDVIRAIRRYLGSQLFHENDKGRIIADHQDNIRMALDKMHIALHYDEFAHAMYLTNSVQQPRLVDDSALIPLRLDIDETFNFRPTKDFFVDVVKHEAWKRPLHPVKEYLNTLTWDGVERLDTWLQRYADAPDSDYLRGVCAIVLIAAVRRIRSPGCKFDEMLILESAKQGIGKSSAIAALCPQHEWFSDDLPLGVDAKEVIERTAGKWLIEASELHGARQREAEHMKAFLSRQVDGPVRMAYDRLPTQVPRQFVIIGTTNSLTGYLKDFSGARRFWPVRIELFRLEELKRDRDQLWAEAAHREAQGESVRLREELWQDAAIAQEQRRAVHPWEEILTQSDEIDLTAEYVLVSKLWSAIGVQANQRSNTHAGILAEIMQLHGFVKKTRRYIENAETGIEEQQWVWVRHDD